MRRIASERHDGRWHGRLVALSTRLLGPLLLLARGRQGLLRDRRGVTALIFAISATVIIGCVGLGTEVGMWYLVRRQTQGVADASAIAGALAANDAVAGKSDPTIAAQTAVDSIATTNGFTDGVSTLLGTVAVASTYFSTFTPGPPSTYVCTPTPPSTTCPAVQVAVSEAVTPLISALFGGKGITVGSQSVAWVQSIGPACALTLTGDLTVSSGTVTAGSCGLASNSNDSTAINITGTLIADTITSVGSYAGTPILNRPAAPFHPPTPDPYSAADTINFGTFSGATCAGIPAPDPATGIIQLTSYEASGEKAYCSDAVLAAGQTLQFSAPGTYIFYNASIIANAGTIQCQFCNSASGVGISIVFLGTPTQPYPLDIGPSAVVSTINASASNGTFPALSGILFYGQSSSPVSISLLSNSPAPMEGAVYFPNANLSFAGNAANPSSCLSLVAATMMLIGTFALNPTGCPGFGTALAQMQGARVVE
jgi:Flp pilus assembly protein TadG